MALKLNPKDGIVFLNRGVSELFLKDTVAACSDWQRAMENGVNAAGQLMQEHCH